MFTIQKRCLAFSNLTDISKPIILKTPTSLFSIPVAYAKRQSKNSSVS